ncbi:MAG: hypothetical protein GY841_10375 [FCB group bacterium]|nr:hypothetical protein [FCB group bacterium]
MKNVENFHVVPVLYPVADAFDGTVNTDIVKCAGEGVLFEITKGVGTTGTSTITIDACDDVTPSNTTAVAFMYRASTTPDTWGAWTQATAAGFATTAGSNQMYQMYVEGGELASEGYGYARLTAVEVANDPVLGGVTAYIVTPHYAPLPYTVLT